MRIDLTNDFHNSETYVRVEPGQILTRAQVRRIKRRLCNINDCTCGDEFGRRGVQPAYNPPYNFQAFNFDEWRVIET